MTGALLPQTGRISDRQFVITSQFSAHASTTALSRSGGRPFVMIDSGALERDPVPGQGRGAEAGRSRSARWSRRGST